MTSTKEAPVPGRKLRKLDARHVAGTQLALVRTRSSPASRPSATLPRPQPPEERHVGQSEPREAARRLCALGRHQGGQCRRDNRHVRRGDRDAFGAPRRRRRRGRRRPSPPRAGGANISTACCATGRWSPTRSTASSSARAATRSSWSAAAPERNKATGRVVDTPKVDIHTFRDGKVVRFQEAYDTLGFARALGAV